MHQRIHATNGARMSACGYKRKSAPCLRHVCSAPNSRHSSALRAQVFGLRPKKGLCARARPAMGSRPHDMVANCPPEILPNFSSTYAQCMCMRQWAMGPKKPDTPLCRPLPIGAKRLAAKHQSSTKPLRTDWQRPLAVADRGAGRRCEVGFSFRCAGASGEIHSCRDTLVALHPPPARRSGSFLALRRMGYSSGALRHHRGLSGAVELRLRSRGSNGGPARRLQHRRLARPRRPGRQPWGVIQARAFAARADRSSGRGVDPGCGVIFGLANDGESEPGPLLLLPASSRSGNFCKPICKQTDQNEIRRYGTARHEGP